MLICIKCGNKILDVGYMKTAKYCHSCRNIAAVEKRARAARAYRERQKNGQP